MPTISEALGNAGAATTIEHNGKTYHASLVIQKLKSKFERWLEQRIRKATLDMKEFLDPAEFRQMCLEANADIATGKYAFGGDASQVAMQSPAGTVAFASFVFNATEDEIWELMEHKGDELRMVLDGVLQQSAPSPKE